MDRLSQAFASADRNGKNGVPDVHRSRPVQNGERFHRTRRRRRTAEAEAASRMRSTIRAQDTVARQGGDEFLVVLPDASDCSAASTKLRKKLISAISRPFDVNGHEIHIGASVGIATYPKDTKDAETLVKYGDIAMYKVKEPGRSA